jgi:cob(I)alamin adenosyltransferase
VPKRRITRVTTRRGDTGETSLADGSSIAKTDPRMHAIGAVDELNSFVGLLVTELDAASAERYLALTARLQQELFDLGAHLATAGAVAAPELGWLDDAVTELNDELPPLTEFVIPGGTRAAALTHVCRTVCRRAERHAWATADATAAARYLNRLSDVLFVIARLLNAGVEPQWRGVDRDG